MDEGIRRAAEAIDAQKELLARSMVDRQYARQVEEREPFGAIGREKSLRDMEYHLTYLCEALSTSKQALFENYVA